MNTSLVLTGASQDKGPDTRSAYLGQMKKEKVIPLRSSLLREHT